LIEGGRHARAKVDGKERMADALLVDEKKEDA
jgi:hypothetical protein